MLEVTPSRYSLFLDQPSHCGNAGRPHPATSFLPSQFSPLHLPGDGRFLGMGSSSSKALNGVWLTDRKRKSDFQIHPLLTRPIVLPKVLCPRMSLRIFKHSPKKNIFFFSKEKKKVFLIQYGNIIQSCTYFPIVQHVPIFSLCHRKPSKSGSSLPKQDNAFLQILMLCQL